jgi:hypothetical protein
MFAPIKGVDRYQAFAFSMIRSAEIIISVESFECEIKDSQYQAVLDLNYGNGLEQRNRSHRSTSRQQSPIPRVEFAKVPFLSIGGESVPKP